MVPDPENNSSTEVISEYTEKRSSLDCGFVIPERINPSDFVLSPESAQHPEYPLQFYTYKDNTKKGGMVVIADTLRIVFPDRTHFPAEIRELITPWDKAEKQVMINQATIDLMLRVGQLYMEGKNAVVMGPSAVSKSYVAGWIMSSLVGLPYFSQTCSPENDATDFFGGASLKPESLDAGSVTKFLEDVDLEEKITTDKHLNSLVEKLRSSIARSSDFESTPECKWLVKRIAKRLRWPNPYTKGQIGWTDSQLITALQTGMWICLDELNRLRDQNFLGDLFEVSKKILRLAGRSNPVYKSRGSFIVGTQNTTSYLGANETPHHLESRYTTIVVGPNDLQTFIDLYRFFVNGQNPTFAINGKTYTWKQDIQTDYRGGLENAVPDDNNRDALLVSLAKLHMTVLTMVEEKKIGRKKRIEGGNFVFDQRDIRSILVSIQKQINGSAVTTDIVKIIKAALYQNYVDGLSKSDMKKVADLIENMPIWKRIGAKSQVDWAAQSAAQVEKASDDTWIVRNQGLKLEEQSPKTKAKSVILHMTLIDGEPVFNEIKISEYTKLMMKDLETQGEIEFEVVYGENGREVEGAIKIVSKGYFGDIFVEMLDKKAQEIYSPMAIIHAMKDM